jgi:hypothetical protein
LLVDEALAVGDVYFRQRCMRKVHELRARGVTILFVSHAPGDVKALGDRAMWLEKGVVRALGRTDLVVAQYLAAMSEKDRAYQIHEQAHELPLAEARNLQAPEEVVEEIPNVDHRFGDGMAEILGITVLDADGSRVASLKPDSTIVVRISARAKKKLDRPIVGFMLRNHLGLDFAGTNTAREHQDLPPMTAGEICTVDFYVDLPALYASTFSFSPAIANGSLEHYSMCDWIDNAVVLQMEKSSLPMYGQFHLACRVKVNTKVGGDVVTP